MEDVKLRWITVMDQMHEPCDGVSGGGGGVHMRITFTFTLTLNIHIYVHIHIHNLLALARI